MSTLYRAIPTNIILGFLGVGKTTVIQWLLKHKPVDEHWAVLVNEFGEVGIDGELLQAEGIAVKQVPGGCMCCAVGVPSRVALNQLIRQQKPDRILIEPSGLAHPRQVMALFRGQEYQGVLDLRATICLIDPWTLTEPRLVELPAFAEQIDVADVLVATKTDVVDPDHLHQFRELTSSLEPAKAKIGEISNGALPLEWLDLIVQHGIKRSTVSLVRSASSSSSEVAPRELPTPDEEGVILLQHSSEDAHSCGWVFSEVWQFDPQAVQSLVESLSIPRIKGLLKIPQGWLSINRMRDNIRIEVLRSVEGGPDSRLEMISLEPCDWKLHDMALRQCGSGH